MNDDNLEDDDSDKDDLRHDVVSVVAVQTPVDGGVVVVPCGSKDLW